MKDGHKPFRTAIWAALNGNLSADFDGSGNNVPVYDENVTDTAPNLYLVLSTQSGTDESNRHSFNTEATQEIQIVHKTGRSVDKRVIDDIANQIFEILWPTPLTDGLVQQAGFQIHTLRKQNDNYLNMQIDSTQTLMRRIITFSARVHQT